MEKKDENHKFDYQNYRFEFILDVNDNIICQRLFDIRGYNEEVLRSMDLKWLIDDCVDIIIDDLKKKSIEQLWKYYNPYLEQTQEDIEKTRVINDKDYFFNFEIKVDKKTVIKRQFDANVFSPNVRFQVDIKDIVSDLIYQIRSVFSQKKFTKNYGEVEL